MRRSGFLIPCLAILLTACNEGVITGPSESDSSETGMVTFTLSADMRNDLVQVKSSAEDISVDEFWVEIFNSSQKRIFCEKYADAKDTTLFINSGEYTLLATYGTENGVGFDKPYYKAEKNFTVGPQEVTDLSLTATLANVKVAVKFDENLGNKLSYDEYWAVVRNNGRKLRFNPSEKRAGYIPAGDLEFVLVVKINGEYKQYVHPAATYAPNDFVTFDVKAGLIDGTIAIKILVDDTVEVVEVEAVEVPVESILPMKEPMILSQGFDGGNMITYTEGKAERLDEVWISAAAEGIMSSAVLDIDCPSLGLPASTDLMTADASTVAAFEEKGIWWKFNDDRTSLAISMTDAYNDHISKIGYAGYDAAAQKCLPVAQISLSIETEKGYVTSAEESFAVVAEPYAATGTFSWNEYDVWAWKIVNPKLTLGEGRYNKTKIQYSTDGSTWMDFQDVTSAAHSMGTVEGLTPGTTYHLRAMYDGWIEVAAPVSFTTEAAQQVGNAGFEDWRGSETEHVFVAKLLSTKNIERPFYEPWKENETDKWWAVNSKVSMPSSGTQTGLNATYNIRCFPVVAYSTASNTGSKSASLQTIAISDWLTTSNLTDAMYYVGELFVGQANDDGSHKTDGHAFASRPSALKFYYRYASNNGEKFPVTIYIKGEKGNKLAEEYVEIQAPQSSATWYSYELPLQYDVTDEKASLIYISFRTANTTSPSVAKDIDNAEHEIAGIKQKAHFGSELRIDDVELVY